MKKGSMLFLMLALGFVGIASPTSAYGDDDGWEAVAKPAAGAGRARCVAAAREAEAKESSIESLVVATARISLHDVSIVDPATLSNSDKKIAAEAINRLGDTEDKRLNILLRQLGFSEKNKQDRHCFRGFDRLLGSYLLAYVGSRCVGYIAYAHPCLGNKELKALKKGASLTDAQVSQIDRKTLDVDVVVAVDWYNKGLHELLMQALAKKFERIKEFRVDLVKNDDLLGSALVRLGLQVRLYGCANNVLLSADTIRRSLPIKPADLDKKFLRVQAYDRRGAFDKRPRTFDIFVFHLIDGDEIVGAMSVDRGDAIDGCDCYQTPGPSIRSSYEPHGGFEILLSALAEKITKRYGDPVIRVTGTHEIADEADQKEIQRRLIAMGFKPDHRVLGAFVSFAGRLPPSSRPFFEVCETRN
jgi:hypothetical protein